MNPTVAVVEALALLALSPLLLALWRSVTQKDSDLRGGAASWIWIPIGGLSVPMIIVMCMIFIGGHTAPPEMWIPLGVGVYFGIFPYVLALARLTQIGRTSIGKLLGFQPSTLAPNSFRRS